MCARSTRGCASCRCPPPAATDWKTFTAGCVRRRAPPRRPRPRSLRSTSEPDAAAIEQAERLLIEMASALHTSDPKRQQIVMPAVAGQAAESSQVQPAPEAVVLLDERCIICEFNQ